MTVIARDAVASDHLVYAWPFPLGPECEVTCAEDEQVVMCPAWLVGDRLGPGRHFWRTPDPTRPVSAFFVLTAPVGVSFDMITMFAIPASGQPVRLRASGSLHVRCVDPGLLIAQFVGLPFERINEGILRSVSRSVERMLARLLTRRVVMTGAPAAVTDPGMLPGIIEELVAYNPTAGAVFGVELIQIGHLVIAADDGTSPYLPLLPEPDGRLPHAGNGDAHRGAAAAAAAQIAERVGEIALLETARGRPITSDPPIQAIMQSSPSIAPPPLPPSPAPLAAVSGEIRVRAQNSPEAAPQLHALGAEVPGAAHDPTPGDAMPNEGARGAILGIGMASIGHGSASAVSGEIAPRVDRGARVLVPGPNGLMQSATVRQLVQGYYELEVGHSGETIWVPVNGVVPEH